PGVALVLCVFAYLALSSRTDTLCIDDFIHQSGFERFLRFEQLSFQQSAVRPNRTQPETIQLEDAFGNNEAYRHFVKADNEIAIDHHAGIAAAGQHTSRRWTVASDGCYRRLIKCHERTGYVHKRMPKTTYFFLVIVIKSDEVQPGT